MLIKKSLNQKLLTFMPIAIVSFIFAQLICTSALRQYPYEVDCPKSNLVREANVS